MQQRLCWTVVAAIGVFFGSLGAIMADDQIPAFDSSGNQVPSGASVANGVGWWPGSKEMGGEAFNGYGPLAPGLALWFVAAGCT